MGCKCTKSNVEQEITKGKVNITKDKVNVKKEESEYKKESELKAKEEKTNEKDEFEGTNLNIVEPNILSPANNKINEEPEFNNKISENDKNLKNLKIDEIENNNNQIINNNLTNNDPPFIYKDETSSKISGKMSKSSKRDYRIESFNLINKIRSDPKAFIPDIEKAKSKIEIREDRLIYNGKVKVVLKEGEAAFDEAINVLKQTAPLKPFILDDNISVPVPLTIDKIKNSKTLNKLIDEKRNQNIEISSFFKDSVKDYYTSVLLLVIDDSGKSKGKKRNSILSNQFTKIGIAYRKVEKTFAAYYTFAN